MENFDFPWVNSFRSFCTFSRTNSRFVGRAPTKMASDNPYRVVLVAGSAENRGLIETYLSGGYPKTSDASYLGKLADAIQAAYQTETLHVYSTSVREENVDGRSWEGVVEVFALVRHPDTNRCYAWGAQKPDGTMDITTVLAIDPINSPQSAVRAMAFSSSAEAKR
jgi:hypothetical protein